MTELLAWNFDEASGTQIVEDHSGNGRTLDLTTHGTDGRDTGHTNGGIVGFAVNTNNYTRVSTGLETASRTLMFWAKRDTEPSDYAQVVWLQNASPTTTWGIGVQTGANTTNAWFRARNQSGANFEASPTKPALGVWAHYAMTFDAATGRVTCYLDGAQVGQSAAGFATSIAASDGTLRVFRIKGTVLDDVRMLDVALSQSEIQSLMNTPVGGGGSVTGSGATVAPAAMADGAGTVSLTGTGTPAAPPATADGTGGLGSTGIGVTAAPAATASGSGTMNATGGGSAPAPAATASGSGELSLTGGGAATAPSATASGDGTAVVTGSVSAAAPAGDADGAATLTILGVGQGVAPAATARGDDRSLVDITIRAVPRTTWSADALRTKWAARSHT